MVDLPTVGNAIVTSVAPQSSVSRQDIASDSDRMAGALSKVADASMDVATEAAKQQAATAVTRDADGKLQVAPPPPLFGPAAVAYTNVAHQSYLVQHDLQADKDVAEARIKYEGKPDLFNEWSSSYLLKQGADAPDPTLRSAIQAQTERRLIETGNGIAARASQVSIESGKQGIAVQQSQLENEMSSLARGGVKMTGDGAAPSFTSRLQQWDGLQKQRLANPLYGYSPTQAAYDRSVFLSKLTGDAKISAVKQVYDDKTTTDIAGPDGTKTTVPNGGYEKAIAEADKVLTDPNLNLSDQERLTIRNRATAELHVAEAQRKSDLTEARKAMRDALAAGDVDPGVEAQITEQLRTLGSPADSAIFSAGIQRKRFLAPFSTMPLHQMQPTIDYVATGFGRGAPDEVRAAIGETTAKTGVPSSYLFRTAKTESNFDPNAQATGSSAGGLFQFTDPTWKDTLGKYGAKYGLGPDTPKTDVRANTLMAGELTKEHAQGLQAAGLPVNEGTLYTAHFAGLGGAQKLLTADKSAAAASILPDAAAANPSIFYDPSGRARTVSETLSTIQGKMGTPDGRITPGLGNDVRVLTGLSKVADTKAKAEWEKVEKDLDAGVRPADALINPLLDTFRLANDTEMLERAGGRLGRFDDKTNAATTPLGTQAAVTTEMRRLGAQGKLPVGAAPYIEDMEKQQQAIKSGLDKNPIATTIGYSKAKLDTPPPIDPMSSDAMRAGLQARVKIATLGAQIWERPALAALDDADMQHVSAALAAGTDADRLRIYSDINTLPEPIRVATLSKLGLKGSSAAVGSFAASLMPQAPEVAAGIIQGQSAMKTKDGYLPSKGNKVLYETAKQQLFPVTAFNLASRANPTGAYATVDAAIDARYASLSAQSGDLTGNYNSARLKQAADEVTGGSGLTHNGAPIMPPYRGAQQRNVDGIMAGIKDDDLEGMTTGSGKPITADYLRQSTKLVALADGRYLVQLNLKDSDPKYAMQAAPGRDAGLHNFAAANDALKLTPEEQGLYQRHLANLTGPGGVDNPPDAQNPQGSRSTLFQTPVEHDGKFYNIPTVWDGKILAKFDANGKFTGAPEAEKRAADFGWDKFPSYKTEDEAEARYQQMHKFMERDTGAYLAARDGFKSGQPYVLDLRGRPEASLSHYDISHQGIRAYRASLRNELRATVEQVGAEDATP